ncbi:MAG TPA: hypothetical protein PLH60_08830 [Proteiniphilum sp.]|nr:hypothetical protein [Proteiniphilum sp.]HPD86937.1 hypothetical protein [Proteiniphilum sp.]HPJ51094.1 hypothetical protein [Proteiniphilum sp.]HPR20644.1 hypothetical protein [Proteiniphilum sp.]
MKKTIFLMFLLVCMHAQAQNQRKLPIREGGQTIDPGNIPEAVRSNDTTLNGATDALRSRPGKMKVGRITLRSAASQEVKVMDAELLEAVANGAKLTKADAGNVLNAFVAFVSNSLRESDKQGMTNGKPHRKSRLIVPVGLDKGLRFSLSDRDADGDGVLDVTAVTADH